jgi:hypothetical protein
MSTDLNDELPGEFFAAYDFELDPIPTGAVEGGIACCDYALVLPRLPHKRERRGFESLTDEGDAGHTVHVVIQGGRVRSKVLDEPLSKKFHATSRRHAAKHAAARAAAWKV